MILTSKWPFVGSVVSVMLLLVLLLLKPRFWFRTAEQSGVVLEVRNLRSLVDSRFSFINVFNRGRLYFRINIIDRINGINLQWISLLFNKHRLNSFVFSSRAIVDAGGDGIDGRFGLGDGDPVTVVNGNVEKFSISIWVADLQVPGLVCGLNWECQYQDGSLEIKNWLF